MKTSLKEVKIICKYIHKSNGKPNGRISYLVRSSNGKDIYCTTLMDGKASGCSCPSKKPCYHMIQLVAIETAHKPVARKSDVKATVTAVSKSAKTVDVGKLGSLNTGRAFSLMR